MHAGTKVHQEGLCLAIADLHAQVGRLQVKVRPISIMHVCNTLQSMQKVPSHNCTQLMLGGYGNYNNTIIVTTYTTNLLGIT